MSKRKIYDIKINGNSITYFQRTQGQTGRDIAAVKLALGNIYLAPKEQNSQDVVPLQNTEGAYTGNIQNNSPEDTSIGEGWFSCDTNEELTIERLLTFDKKLKSSLMAFQIKHQLLVFAYYFEKYYAKNIKTDDEESLLQQVSFMINAFDIEFGTIGEATIAILHGYRPGANASNSSFVSAEENPLDVIPKSLYDSYVNGEMEQLPDTILDSIYSREEVDFSQIKDVWSLAASTLRRWEMKVPTVEVAYVKYIAHSYIGNLKESDLLVATREILEYIENPKFTQDLSPSQRQNLISRAFEPDPHTDPDPFVISLNKVGFFNRTSYTFRDLPEFDNLQQQTRQSLELSALNKVLEFYKKQQVEEIEDPEIINFIDFRAPSLRPNDVYRAYFELDKELIDNSPSATPQPAIATTEAANESASAELDRVNKEISELYCADGSTPNAEEARIQYERYRSFAAKKKLEITRKIRQTILENQEQDLNIDGVEIDLGVFGKGSLSESDIQNLIGSFGNAVIGGASSLTGQGIDWLMGNSDAGNTSQTVGNSLVINYNTLVDYIDKVSENFEKAQEDLANFELEGDPYFSAVEEANKLKNIPNDLLTLLGGDISFSEQLESRGTNMDNYIGNDNTFITFTFSDVSVGSRIIKVQIQSDTVEPTSAFTNFAATEIAQAIQSGQNRLAPQEGYLNGSMRRYRTVHYLRNIEDLADKSSSVANFFNKLANPDSTCDTDDKSKKVGTGAEYILRHTKGITKNKKPSPFNPIHNWRNPSGAKAIQNIKQHGKSVLDRKDKEYYGFIKTGVEMEKVFGFEEALPQLGPPIDTTTIGSANKDLGQKLLKEVSSLLDYKRLMCEYAACLGVPDVQVSIPNLSLPEWPKIPMMELPGSDFKEKLWKMIKDIFYRALYTFLKGIIDILKTPFCSEKFVEDLYGAASDTAPIIKKALGDGLLDTGVPIEKLEKAQELLDALLGLLTPSELCALLNGDIVNDSVYHIVRATATAYNLTQELETEEQISNFFITLGLFVGPEICDNLNRYNNIQETCEDVYSILGQMRSAMMKGEEVTQEQLKQASDAAKKEFEKKRDALNFLAGEGGLADLLPDLTALEGNPIFSVPSEFVLESAKLAANSVLKLSKTAFVRSLNSFVSSFYVDEQRIAIPGDDLYEAEANATIQRATCNLQRFANFTKTNEFDIGNLANRTATDSLRKALIILSDDYEKTAVTDAAVPYQVYTLNDLNTATATNNGSLLKLPLSDKYPIYDADRSEAATLSLGMNRELSKNWEYLFPISAGDLNETTRTISNFDNWLNPIFRGEEISATDVLTLNTNYLNKMNQIVSRLQQDITSNIEKAFRITPESKFLSVIGTFYEIEEEADPYLRSLNINQEAKELIDASNYATSITLNHPVLPAEQASVKFQDEKIMVGDKIHVLDQISLEDDFFFGTGNQPKIFKTCEPIPESLEGLFSGASAYRRDIKKTLFYEFFKKMFNSYLSEYSTNNISIDQATGDELLKVEFQEVNEGLIEQIVSAVRESRIFNDAAYLNRMDSKLRSRFYYDPVTKCFKNPNNSMEFGIFNYEKIVTEEFEKQYMREYGRPENSDLLRDYNKPGAFQKALMNTAVLGFVRVALIDLLLKGSISFSVWGFDSLKSGKLFRDYIVSFIENQFNQEDFFVSNREMLDETLIRLAGTNNISAAIRKITLTEVDTTISDLSMKLFETESTSGTESWFLDHIPLVGVPESKDTSRVNTRSRSAREELWVSNLKLDEINKFRKNSFSFMEEYVRVYGPLRDFESSYGQIAAAQYNQLQSRLPDIQSIVNNTSLSEPDLRMDRIASRNAIDINIEADNDRWPNKELLSINEFSEVIRSLLDNNKELSKYFHDLQDKIYEPNNILTHGAPKTLKRRFPHRPIVRTRKRFEFSGANIFSALFHDDAETGRTITRDLFVEGDGIARNAVARGKRRKLKQDKFRTQNKINIQPKDSAYYWALIHGANAMSAGITLDLNESSYSSQLRKSLNEVQDYETRYYVSPISLEKALSQYEEQVQYMTTAGQPDLNYFGRRPTSAMADTLPGGIEDTDSGLITTSLGDTIRRRQGIASYDYLKDKGPSYIDGAEPPHVITRRYQQSGRTLTETLFENMTNKVTKAQFDAAVSSSAEPEYWEETIIDLVGDASPIFNQPGYTTSSVGMSYSLTNDQKVDLGKKLQRAKFYLNQGYRDNLCKSVASLTDTAPDKFLFSVGLDPDDSSKITRARFAKPFRHIIHDDDGYGWDRNHTYDNMEFPGCFDLTYASNKGIKYNKVAGRASPGVFEIDQPHELLGLNDYKIPLRILITQVKSASGEILQVFVRYILPQFIDFSNSAGNNLSFSPTAVSELQEYRQEALIKACKETFDAYEYFMEDTVYDMLEELAVIDRDKYDEFRKRLYTDGVVNKRKLKPGVKVHELIKLMTPSGNGVQRAVPPFRYPGTSDDNAMANPFSNSNAASWMSHSKFYSIAAQNEAKDKIRNFQTSQSFLDSQFKFTGALMKKPATGLSKQEFLSLTGDSENTANWPLYKMQEHYLYQESMKDLIQPVAGRSDKIVEKSNEKCLQTIGNLVNWFNQRRVDAFFGYTTKNNFKIQTTKQFLDKSVKILSEVNPGYNPDAQFSMSNMLLRRPNLNPFIGSNASITREMHQEGFDFANETLRNNFRDLETSNNTCGPSLFPSDERASTDSMWAAIKQSKFEFTFYDDKVVAGTDMLANCNNSLIDGSTGAYYDFEMRSNEFNMVNQLSHHNGQAFEQIKYYFDPRYREDRRPIPKSTYRDMSMEDFKKAGLYVTPSSILHSVCEFDYNPDQIYEDTVRDYFKNTIEAEFRREMSYPSIIAGVTARYNAVLEEIGIMEIIRDVTTRYVSRLEGDESIVLDILADSEISHGIRIMQANPYKGGTYVDSMIANNWLRNSEVSEEERMGVVLIGDKQYRTYPVSSFEQPLTSLDCFMAATPLQFKQKLKEQLPYMKCELQNQQSFINFFDFIVPYKTFSSMLAMHGITLLSGYGDMPTIMDSAKTGLAGAFSQAAMVDPTGDSDFAVNYDNSDLIAAFGTPGPVGGQPIDCFDPPNMRQWWKLIKEMLKQYAKYFPSIILRGIADGIDPAYKEMKRHYLSCELPDLTNRSWGASSGAGNVPLGLRGGQQGNKKSIYAPLIPAFPVDVVKGVMDFPDPAYLLKSVDKLVGYIYGGQLPLLDPASAFKIPCLEIDQKSPNSWAPYTIGNSGRYGQPLNILTLLALSTYQLPNDIEMRRNICNREDIDIVVACDDEQE